MPFDLPDWVPHWVLFAATVIAGLLLLAFLLMPFSVFGLKGRLEGVEARLDEIQGEIRSLALRLPESPVRATEYEPMGDTAWDDAPPIPPRRTGTADRLPPARRVDARGARSEPRFDPR